MLLIFAVIAALLSCTKSNEDLPAPSAQVQSKKCMAATFVYRHYSDFTFKKLDSVNYFHFHAVCDDLLETYKKYPQGERQYCDQPDTEQLILHIDTCKIK